ncbi:uncharacterized protein [Porites lutea]|uniref:uncharacterized protein n=1 Tax=Porites lutea TaxID=51062 RepID=UPI003CC68333
MAERGSGTELVDSDEASVSGTFDDMDKDPPPRDTPPPPPPPKTTGGGKRRCYKCDGRGHTSHVCPSPEFFDMKLECFSCGGYGHKRFKCPTAQRRKKKNKRGKPKKKEENSTKVDEKTARGKYTFNIYNQ